MLLMSRGRLPSLLSSALFVFVLLAAFPPVSSGQESSGSDQTAAGEESSGQPIEILLEEMKAVYHEDGRVDITFRTIHRVLTTEGLSWLSSHDEYYVPWLEERPVITATVKTRDGRSFTLDPSTIAEGTLGSESTRGRGGIRQLTAPIPGLEVGAVLDKTVVTRQRRTFLGPAGVRSFNLDYSVPAKEARLIIEVPPNLSLSYVPQHIKSKPKVSRIESGTRYVFESRNLAATPGLETYLAPEDDFFPRIRFSIKSTWTEEAERLLRVLEPSIRLDEAAPLTEGLSPLALGKIVPRQTLEEVVKRLHQKVTDSGVGFGESGVTALSPAETLAQGAGSSQDLAVLLVSALRRLQIPAELALVRSSDAPDVPADLPALNLFDHILVVVPGAQEVWIDPRDPFVHVGQLPLACQGRNALMLVRGIKRLSQTPPPLALDNTYREERTLLILPDGGLKVVERSSYSGELERDLRKSLDTALPEKQRKELEKYVTQLYGKGLLTLAEHTEPRDLSSLMRFHLEADLEPTQQGDISTISVGTTPSILAYWLPPPLKSLEKGGALGRKHDFAMPMPHRVELVCKMVPMAGYTPRALPEPFSFQTGDFLLRFIPTQADDGSVTLTWTLDTGKGRYTPTAAMGIVLRMVAFAQSWPQVVTFEDRAKKDLEAGEVARVLKHYQELVGAHPEESFYQERYASALLEAGFGTEAVEAARVAVAISPTRATGYILLADILEHDEMGRRFSPGWDRAGALAAYREALKVNPKATLAAAGLAILLERDEKGRLVGNKADRLEAMNVHRRLLDELDARGMEQNLLNLLVLEEGFEELETRAEKSLDPERQQLFRVVARAGLKGGEAAALELLRLEREVEARKKVVLKVHKKLLLARRYDEARALWETSNLPLEPAEAQQVALLKKLKRWDVVPLTSKTPEEAFRAALPKLLSGPALPDDLCAFLAPVACGARKDFDALRDGVEDAADASFGDGYIVDVMLDVWVSSARAVVDGSDETGYRVTLRPGAGVGVGPLVGYLLKSGDGYQVVAVGAMQTLRARAALEMLLAGNVSGARTWVNWEREEWNPPVADPFEGSAFVKAWPLRHTGGAEELKMALAMLILADEPKEAAALLQSVNAEALTSERQVQLLRARFAAAISSEQAELALTAAEELKKASPDAVTPFRLRAQALTALKRYGEALEELEAADRAHPGELEILLQRIRVLEFKGDYAEALRLGRAFHEKPGERSAALHNSLAWIALLNSNPDAKALEDAMLATDRGRSGSRSALHTLASIHAERGELHLAKEALLTSLGSRDTTLEPADRYVLARMAEQAGLTDMARSIYTQLEGELKEENTTSVLVQRRLEALKPGMNDSSLKK